MKLKNIDALAASLIRNFRTRNPFVIAQSLGIHVEYDDIGLIKGYYTRMNRLRLIVISENICEEMQRLVCAHELGHDRLHFGQAIVSPLRDAGFQSLARTEVEANRFAANILVDDEAFLEHAYQGYTSEAIAAMLHLCPEVIKIKASILCGEGLQIRLPDMPVSGFLKGL